MHPLRGILFKVLSVATFMGMASLIKAASDVVPPGQAVFFRSFFALPIIFGWLALRGELAHGWKTKNPLGHFWRGLVGTSAMGLGFTGLGLLPLPEVTAIGYAAPLLVVVFASMQTILQFYGAMTLIALANAGIGDVSIGSVLTRWFAKRRSLALGLAMSGSNIGTIAFLAALGVAIDDVGWRDTALTVGLGGLAVIIPAALAFVRDPEAGEGEEAEEQRAEGQVRDQHGSRSFAGNGGGHGSPVRLGQTILGGESSRGHPPVSVNRRRFARIPLPGPRNGPPQRIPVPP